MADGFDIVSYLMGKAAGGGGGGGGGDDPFALKKYIQATGTQWIDTGYYLPADQTGLVFDAVVGLTTSPARNATVFGTRRVSSGSENPGANALMITESWNNNGISGYQFGSQYANGFDDSLLVGRKTHITLTKGAVRFDVDNQYRVFSNAFNSTYNAIETASVYLFTLNTAGSDAGAITHSKMKLYRFRIYEGTVLVHEFVPWKDADGIVCLKDTVTGSLKYNAGTGDFSYGEDQ